MDIFKSVLSEDNPSVFWKDCIKMIIGLGLSKHTKEEQLDYINTFISFLGNEECIKETKKILEDLKNGFNETHN